VKEGRDVVGKTGGGGRHACAKKEVKGSSHFTAQTQARESHDLPTCVSNDDVLEQVPVGVVSKPDRKGKGEEQTSARAYLSGKRKMLLMCVPRDSGRRTHA